MAANFPSNCLQCHTTAAWQPAKFDHSTVNFVLTGAHTVPPRQCTDCHVNDNYNLTSTTCVSCHLKDFQGATNPNHVSGGFAQTCETCHTTAAWQPATFDHAKSGFPLTGAHTVPPRQCTDCHVNNNFNITSTTCVSCHQNDFNNAVSPVAHAGFPTTCQQCHDTVQWTDAKFDHSTDRIHADRCAHGSAAAVYRLSRQQQLQHHRDRLRQLPSDRLQYRHHAGAAFRVPDNLRPMS